MRFEASFVWIAHDYVILRTATVIMKQFEPMSTS